MRADQLLVQRGLAATRSQPPRCTPRFSRHMPSADAARAACARAGSGEPWQMRVLLAVCVLGVAVALTKVVLTHGWLAPLAVLAAAAALLWMLGQARACRLRLHWRALADTRAGEGIGSFARQANCRLHDPWVVRAVYETLAQEQAAFAGLPHFALRWDDDLWRTLRLDPDDVDMALLPVMAARAGRSLADTSANPWLDRVRTVGDLVRFLCAQPCAGASAASPQPHHPTPHAC